MEAFKVGDIIAPHYSLRLFDKHGNSNLILPEDVIVVLEVGTRRPRYRARAWDVTLLLYGGVVRQYVTLDPAAYEVVISA
jgi:hypothetical protein